MCVYPILAPSHIYREEQMGLHLAFAVGEAPSIDIGKLLAKAEGRWWDPLVGRLVGPPLATAFGQEASWWVPMALTRA